MAVTVDDIKDALDKTEDADNAELQRILTAALRAYERHVGPLPGTRTQVADGGLYEIVLDAEDATLVSVTYGDGTVLDLDDLDLSPSGVLRWRYGTSGRFSWGRRYVTVEYTVGDIPEDHAEAIIEDARGYWVRTQRGGGASRPSFEGEGDYDPEALPSAPLTMFPRIQALAPAVLA